MIVNNKEEWIAFCKARYPGSPTFKPKKFPPAYPCEAEYDECDGGLAGDFVALKVECAILSSEWASCIQQSNPRVAALPVERVQRRRGRSERPIDSRGCFRFSPARNLFMGVHSFGPGSASNGTTSKDPGLCIHPSSLPGADRTRHSDLFHRLTNVFIHGSLVRWWPVDVSFTYQQVH